MCVCVFFSKKAPTTRLMGKSFSHLFRLWRAQAKHIAVLKKKEKKKKEEIEALTNWTGRVSEEENWTTNVTRVRIITSSSSFARAAQTGRKSFQSRRTVKK